VLTNTSTGRTGAGIAARMARGGHEVVLLRARSAAEAPAGCRQEVFTSFADLDRALARLLSSEPFDAIIHAAAVGDFGVEAVLVDGTERAPSRGKLDSDSAPVIRLRSNPKLVDSLRSRSMNGSLRVVAFKLTRGEDDAGALRAVDALLAHSGADLVIHNDLAEREGPDAFPSTIHFSDGSPSERCGTRRGLEDALERILTSLPADAAVPA
jgi:phosphopantothenoylcysteine synthetase/decarboxylase